MGLEKEKGKLWCPFCGKHRLFKGHYRGDDYKWCQVCGISDCDYHVKVINKIDSGEATYQQKPAPYVPTKISERLVVHKKVFCQRRDCLDHSIRIQYLTQEEKHKKTGIVTMYCPRCSIKSTADAKALRKWVSAN